MTLYIQKTLITHFYLPIPQNHYIKPLIHHPNFKSTLPNTKYPTFPPLPTIKTQTWSTNGSIKRRSLAQPSKRWGVLQLSLLLSFFLFTSICIPLWLVLITYRVWPFLVIWTKSILAKAKMKPFPWIISKGHHFISIACVVYIYFMFLIIIECLASI